MIVLVTAEVLAVSAHAEDMAKLGHPGWQAAEGSGCLVWNPNPKSGSTVTWSGPCKDNRASGQGELVWRWREAGKSKTGRHVGEMRDGKFLGRGIYKDSDGDLYEGDWVDSKLHGHGKFEIVDTVRYEGDWVEGKKHGHGTEVWKSGDRYEGEWVKHKRTGRGTYVWPPGEGYKRYEGDWVDDKMHGHGTMVYVTGDRYEGDWVDGERTNSRGTFTWANGDHYKGDFVGKKRSGHGRMTKANGDWYDGEWSGDYANGEGKAKINGKKYKGVWARGCLRSMEQRAAWEVPRHRCP